MTLFQTGFRPFFLLAAVFGAFAMAAWLALLGGALGAGPRGLVGTEWHAHEMIFGFGGAVLAGFFLTATPAWTSRPKVSGAPLAALSLLWCLGRVGAWVGGSASMFVDLAFLPLLAVLVAVPVVRARRWRNAGFPPLLLAMAVANGALWLGLGSTRSATTLALDAVAAIIVVFGGRVVPMFTRNATGAAVTVDVRAGQVCAASVSGLVVVDLVGLAWPAQWVAGAIAVAGGLATLWRMRAWGQSATLRRPLLWVMHLGYALTALGLVARGAAALTESVPWSAAIHLLALGSVGTMMLAMMARVALGHSGRPLVASPVTGAAFAVMGLAVVARVSAGLWPGSTLLHSSGALFIAGMVLYLAVYLPILTQPRADGKAG